MLLWIFLIVSLLEVSCAQRALIKGERRDAIPRYNHGHHPPGLMQDLSHARILSNEPFIISFEFPKVSGKGTRTGKPRFAAKRPRANRKRNRRIRQFRQTILPQGDVLSERRKRLEKPKWPSFDEDAPIASMIFKNPRRGKNRHGHLATTTSAPSTTPATTSETILSSSAIVAHGDEARTTEIPENPQTMATENERYSSRDAVNGSKAGDESNRTNTAAHNQNYWSNVKDKSRSEIVPQHATRDNELEGNDWTDIGSGKMRANCLLLRFVQTPHRNPYFYKLLPPDYPAFVMDEEKQLQCKQYYDIIDLARDKEMIAGKIDQLEKILESDLASEPSATEPLEGTSKTRKTRSLRVDEPENGEEKNTLQDESLQGKSEGEIRSDRSKRTKLQAERRARGVNGRGRAQRDKNRVDGVENGRGVGKVQKNERSPPAQGETAAEEVRPKKKFDDKDSTLKVEESEFGKRRSKQEIAPPGDSFLQNVFSPSEVNKVIKQKEREANIFDKVVRTMKKYEEKNVHEESSRPRKRESPHSGQPPIDFQKESNETASLQENNREVEDAVNKLAKIFKILGIGKEGDSKCDDCEDEEDDGKAARRGIHKIADKVKMGKPSSKCTCTEKEEDCPLCYDCMKCFKECRRNALASKNPYWSRLGPVAVRPKAEDVKNNWNDVQTSEPATGSSGTNSTEKSYFTESAAELKEEKPPRYAPKPERMYRSKLSPNRDHIRVYFDNPENKLLVWTKRGRRTMPWGPLTSDLQLYRDRARQILKSAEDILKRIKETQDKIHEPEGHGEGEMEQYKVDEVIQEVVNENATKSILQTPWGADSGKNENIEGSDDQNTEDGSGALEKVIANLRESEYPSVGVEKVPFEENDEPHGSHESLQHSIAAGYEKDEREPESADVKSAVEEDLFDFDHEEEEEESKMSDNVKSENNYEEVSGSIEADVELIHNDGDDLNSWKGSSSENYSPEVREAHEPGAEGIEGERGPEGRIDGAEGADGQQIEENGQAETEEYGTVAAKVEAVHNVEREEEPEVAAAESDEYREEPHSDWQSEEVAEESVEDVVATEGTDGNEASPEETFHLEHSFRDDAGYEEHPTTTSRKDTAQEELIAIVKKKIGQVEDEGERGKEGDAMLSSSAATHGPTSAEGNERDSSTSKDMSTEIFQSSQKVADDVEGERRNDSRESADAESEDTVQETATTGHETPPSDDSSEGGTEGTREDPAGEENPREDAAFEDHIKDIEKSYAIKGATQKEEKEVILKALLNTADEDEGKSQASQESREGDSETGGTEPFAHGNSFTTLVTHLENGHVDSKDLEVVQGLDKSKIDDLIGEWQAKDEEKGLGLTTTCETRMKLCQAACGCGNTNGTAIQLTKYDIIKGLLTWLKELQLDQMTPISV